MDVVVEPLDPWRAGEAELTGVFEVRAAAQEVDAPTQEPVTPESVVARLRSPMPGLGETRHWLARRDDDVVGTATVIFPEAENSGLALVEVIVHPRSRRRGIGTAVLRALVPELTARGRDVVEGMQITKGGAGEAWAAATGFRTVNESILQRLRFADVDPVLWDVPVPDGYRLEQWIGAAPAELVASYAAAKQAIHDAPRGDAALREPAWTVDRVRAAEAEALEQRVEERVVVAVAEGTGEVAGLTQLWLHPRRPTWAYQRDTAVLAAHRGHGLGLAVKARMLRWLTADRPDLDLVYTGTSADNVHMAGLNHLLGFATVRSTVEVNRTVAGLLEALGGVDAEQRQPEDQHP